MSGYQYLALSDPSPKKFYARVGWIQFKQDTNMDSALGALDKVKVSISLALLCGATVDVHAVSNRSVASSSTWSRTASRSSVEHVTHPLSLARSNE